MDILLVGTYTQHDAPAVLEKQELGKGIYLIPYNEILGDVAGTPLIIQMQNPSWVCLVKNRLFAVSESENAAEIVVHSDQCAINVKKYDFNIFHVFLFPFMFSYNTAKLFYFCTI